MSVSVFQAHDDDDDETHRAMYVYFFCACGWDRCGVSQKGFE